MDDDFNTPRALASLFNLVSETYKFIEEGSKQADYGDIIFTAVETIEKLGREVLGLFLREPDLKLTPEDEKFLNDRKQARQSKDFKKADELRDLLKQRGIVVEDSKDGQTWRFA